MHASARPRFAAALSTDADTHRAVEDVCSRAAKGIGDRADLALLFVSHHHGPAFAPLVEAVCDRLDDVPLIGCTGDSIIADDREIEGQPAVVLWLAQLPGATVRMMHLEFERVEDDITFIGWPHDCRADAAWPDDSALLLLGEPFSFPADVLLEQLNEQQPGVPIIGGMASGGGAPGENRVFLHRVEHEQGAVAARIHGDVRVRPVVSQGCRPIGRPYVVTKAEQNVIYELGGQPPLAILQEMLPTLSAHDQQLVRQGLHVGRVLDEYRDQFRRGDFLIRNVIGADAQSGAIAVGDFVRPGQTVQFQLRDATSADDDMRELLATDAGSQPLAALLFTCNGRGTRLFDTPHHDAGVLRDQFGEIPVAGFFAQGEIGPVAGKNHIHGFTASMALFETKG